MISDVKEEIDDEELEVGAEVEVDDETDDAEGLDEGQLQIPEKQRRASMEARDFPLIHYHRLYQQGRLNLNPDWQRDYVWKGKRPSFLIESLLMQIPIPVIFLSRTKDEKYEVIDGVQRLTTIFNFFEGKFRLKELEVFSELNGKKFGELDQKFQSQLEDAVITSFQLSENTSQDLRFSTFERINTGGMSLNEMEIRNCIYRGKLNTKLRELAANPDFHKAINMKNLSDRMLDRNLVLRFLAFDQIKYSQATAGIKAFLNRFFENYRNPSDEMLADFEKRFKRAMRNSFTVFGSNAFRIRKIDRKGGGEWAPKPNASIFQVIATSLASFDSAQIAQNADAIHEEYLDLLQDQLWLDAVTKSTGDAKKIKYAFDAWTNRLDALMASTSGLDPKRAFTLSFKKELYDTDSMCRICGNEIKSINDAMVDHVDQYWKGGATVPSNARLVHRACNLARPKAD
ncbi:hypothetical protein CN311_23160 [Mesorhizobium sanjuanii]|uniref:HNH nuclease domain-containing protein n=1 Tax=Mesorhizobium sanjuanii TaxID=2037900 RepID=A0A2A6FAR0_9HYPH|nr:DUF262 domain-containing protein [Mesorhizobium sanjuanii]PDQ18741.1 hypothetical protein CN311_23160 [Mesorhizobium sanjuanii]